TPGATNVVYASAPPNPIKPAPATPSVTRIARRLIDRRARATPVARMVTHVRLPIATPATSSTAAPVVRTSPAALVAAKMAPQDTMVEGLDAVPPSAVRNARCGLDTSNGVSSPMRTRSAAYSVRAPSHTSTIAPTRPSARRTGWMARNGVAPPAPAAAYRPSTAAMPAPIATPTFHPLRSVDLIRNRDIGPSWSATKNPNPNPTMAAFIAQNFSAHPPAQDWSGG